MTNNCKWRFNICWYFLKQEVRYDFPSHVGEYVAHLQLNSSQYLQPHADDVLNLSCIMMDSLHKAGLMSLHEVILSEDTGPGPHSPHREHGGHPGLPGLETLLSLRHPLVPTGLGVWSRELCIMDILTNHWSCGANLQSLKDCAMNKVEFCLASFICCQQHWTEQTLFRQKVEQCSSERS